jgi:hypothetical protein
MWKPIIPNLATEHCQYSSFLQNAQRIDFVSWDEQQRSSPPQNASDEEKAEAVDAVKHYRSTEASQFDWITN